MFIHVIKAREVLLDCTFIHHWTFTQLHSCNSSPQNLWIL